jgi:hypothetical protein
MRSCVRVWLGRRARQAVLDRGDHLDLAVVRRAPSAVGMVSSWKNSRALPPEEPAVSGFAVPRLWVAGPPPRKDGSISCDSDPAPIALRAGSRAGLLALLQAAWYASLKPYNSAVYLPFAPDRFPAWLVLAAPLPPDTSCGFQ